MNGFLLDTNVISMLSPSRSDASKQFLDWLECIDGEGRLFVSAVTVVEIEKGIALLEHKGATAKAASLRAWLIGLITTYDDKILGLDSASATFAGQLEAKAIAAGHNSGMADAIIAGIAKAHNLTIVTCNTKHFLPFGIDVASPDEAVATGQSK
ncbi:MAG: type II toxin-antitoxin system VapC family toxin [Pseudomonadota bacterium]